MAIEKHILAQPMWGEQPSYDGGYRDVLTSPDRCKKLGLAWGIGTHDQWLGFDIMAPLADSYTWQKFFYDKKNLYKLIEDPESDTASITINLGWHLWPQLDYYTGNELLELTAYFKDCKNFDTLRWRFSNPMDLHNVGEQIRSDWFITQIKYLDEKNIDMHLCNYEMVQHYKKLLPVANVQWDNIYFQRMVNQNKEHTLYVNEEVRNKHAICLNHFGKEHRTKVVEYIQGYGHKTDYRDKAHISYIRPPKHIEPCYLGNESGTMTMDTGVTPTGVPHSEIGKWQDSPPFKYMNDAYIYIATETWYSSENTRQWLPKNTNIHMGDCTFITEKTLKGFYFQLPMLVVGTPRTLLTLKELGFKTFPEFFNETYDDEVDPDKRMKLIHNNIKDIMSKSISYLHELYWSDDVQAKLKHNRKLFNQYSKNTAINKYDLKLHSSAYHGMNPVIDSIYYD